MPFLSCAGTSLLQVAATDMDLVDNTVTYSISYANFNFSIDPYGTIRNLLAFPASYAIPVRNAR